MSLKVFIHSKSVSFIMARVVEETEPETLHVKREWDAVAGLH